MAIEQIIEGESVGSMVGKLNADIRRANLNSIIQALTLNDVVNGVLLPADPSIVTVTELGSDASLTKFVRYDTNPEKFSHSAAINVFYQGRQARLHTTTVTGTGNVGAGANQTQPAWEFYIDAQDIIIEVGANSQYTLQIDGIFYSKTKSNIGNDGDNDNNLLLNFADKRARKITLNFNTGAAGFGGVYILPTDSVWAVDMPISMCIFGDSFGTGTSTNPAGLAWTSALPKSLGILDYQVSAVGGTGFYAFAGTQTNYADRALTDCNYRDFDIIVAATSTNDRDIYDSDPAALESAFSDWYTTVRSNHPNSLIIIPGSPRSVTPRSGESNGFIGAEQTVLDAAAALNDPLLITIPVLTSDDPPVFGSGNEGNLQGDGNADLYVSSDGLHYNDAGHNFHAVWLSIKILAKLRSLVI